MTKKTSNTKRVLIDTMKAKLVRDRIPDRIRSRGLVPVTRIASEKELLVFTTMKLYEEARELLDAVVSNDKKHVREEFGDVCEIFALCRAQFERKFGKKSLAAARRCKKKTNGGFDQRFILMDIREPSSF